MGTNGPKDDDKDREGTNSPNPERPAGRAVVILALAATACGPTAQPIDVVESTIARIQESISEGRTTCRMVVQTHLDRIEAYDESTVNAITVVNANALGRADEIDAVVIAKTNMAEWAFSPRQTVSSSYDTTANAYDLERVPAGSSGGTASGCRGQLRRGGAGE